MKKTMRLLALSLLTLVGGQAMGQTSTTSETLRVWMDDVSIKADGESITYIKVYEHDVQDYTSFNMSLMVPEGIHIAQVKSGRGTRNAIDLSVRAAETHSINCNMPTSTQINIICTSSQNDNLYPDDEDGNPVDELFSIGLVADPTMVNGTYEVTTEGVKFVFNSGDAFPGFIPAVLPTLQLTVTGGLDALEIPYTLKEDGVGTLCLPFDAEVPSGLQVFMVTGIVDGHVTLESINTITVGTPLIVTGEAGTYLFRGVPTAAGTEFKQGVLSGTTKEKVVTSGYVLQKQRGRVAFFYIDAERPITIPAYRCWLNKESDARELAIDFGSATSLHSVIGGQGSAEVYDVNGRRIDEKSAKIYIKRGTKFLNKR